MIDFRKNISRRDGRPEAYEAPADFEGGACVLCTINGKTGLRYKHGEIVMTSPIDSQDGLAHLVCIGHLPKNIVIYDPVTNYCRNRDGSHTWQEFTGLEPIEFIPPKDVGLLDE